VEISACFCAVLLAGSFVLSLKAQRWATPSGPVTRGERPVFSIGMAARGTMFILFVFFAIGLLLSV
jgi:hypothetical protein